MEAEEVASRSGHQRRSRGGEGLSDRSEAADGGDEAGPKARPSPVRRTRERNRDRRRIRRWRGSRRRQCYSPAANVRGGGGRRLDFRSRQREADGRRKMEMEPEEMDQEATPGTKPEAKPKARRMAARAEAKPKARRPAKAETEAPGDRGGAEGETAGGSQRQSWTVASTDERASGHRVRRSDRRWRERERGSRRWSRSRRREMVDRAER